MTALGSPARATATPAFPGQFLSMDPDTGDMLVYIFDGEVCRIADGEDVLASFEQVLVSPNAGLEGPGISELDLEEELDNFIRRHEGAYR